MKTKINAIPVTDTNRALLGFGIGCVVMLAIVHVFIVNSFDFENMQRGVRLVLSGVNPWAVETRIPHFYNPPFAVLFLWPMLFATPKVYLVMGGALLCAFVFYQRAWAALAWFATNTFLWLVASGGIDMFVIGAGLFLLIAGDRSENQWNSTFWRVLGYGILMVKPQGGLFIVALYILMRRDWKGLLISVFVYLILFLPLYPDWLRVLLTDPPGAQTVASHTLLAKFGPAAAGTVVLLVMTARKWKYWQLGGALAGILMPYGMPGLPIFLTLTAVRPLKAVPIVILYSGLLAFLTWINLPAKLSDSDYQSLLMAIYHLSMLGLALTLACVDPGQDAGETISVGDWIKSKRSVIISGTKI